MSENRIVDATETDELPVGSVVRCVNELGDTRGVYVRRGPGLRDWTVTPDRQHMPPRIDRPVRGDYEVLYEPPAPAPKVGDVITNAGQASRLPVGTLCVEIPADDDAPNHVGDLLAVKIRDDRWMYPAEGFPATQGDNLFDGMRHRVVYLPEAS